jgi:hypothetical protein
MEHNGRGFSQHTGAKVTKKGKSEKRKVNNLLPLDIFFEENLVVSRKSSTFAPAKIGDGPFVYRLGREIFIL